MVAADGDTRPVTWKRTVDYVLDTAGGTTKGEKVASYRVTNCGTDDPADAATLILATQAANTRSKSDKTYHLVYSFPPGEKPHTNILHAIEDELCVAIGYEEHQRVSAVHIDKDHFHVHVAINKVHPTGLQNIEPYYDKYKLMAACEQLEEKYNLQKINHGIKDREKNKVCGSAADIEAQSGIETLIGYVKREIADNLREATNWHDLHKTLAEYGVEIRQRGAGLVIGDVKLGIWAKASSIGRDLSIKALSDRLGEFRAAGHDNMAKSGKKSYHPRPLQRKNPVTDHLFSHYQRERQEVLFIRHQCLEQIRKDSTALNIQVRQMRQSQRLLVKATGKSAVKRLAYSIIKRQADDAYENNRQIIRTRRQNLFKQTALLGWVDWLAEQAEKGNIDALHVLRQREEKTRKWSGNLLTGERADQAKTIILTALKPITRKNGTVAYNIVDGGLVVDRRSHIHAQNATTGAALVALELSSKRFVDQNLIVEGSETFRLEVAKLAGMHRFNVRFCDPEIERVRLKALNEKINKDYLSRELDAFGKNNAEFRKSEASIRAIEDWIVKRNVMRKKMASIPCHRLWQPCDAGMAIYQGRRCIGDNIEVLLLKRGEEILVKPSIFRVVAKASTWKIGTTVYLDRRGRFTNKNSGMKLE